MQIVEVRSRSNLEALVANYVMQHPGKTVWYISDNDHSSMIDFDWKGEADRYLEQHKHYGMFKTAGVYKRQDYPLYAYNRFHAGEVEERLRQEGWLVSVKQKPDDYPFLNNDGDVRINTRCVLTSSTTNPSGMDADSGS